MVKKAIGGRGKQGMQGKRMRGGNSVVNGVANGAVNGNVVNGQGNQGNGRDTNSVLSEVYDGAATFGQFMALLALIVGSIVSSILLLVSLYLLTRTSNYKSTSATVVSVTSCSNVSSSSSSSYENNKELVQCQVAFKYTVDSKEYTNTITTGPQNVGSTVTLRYDVKNPNNVTNNLISKGILGWILFGFAILIIAGVSLNYYIAQRFKFAAAGNGVTSIF